MLKTASNRWCGCGEGAGICCTHEQSSPIVLINVEAGRIRDLEHFEDWSLALASWGLVTSDSQFHGVAARRGDEFVARPGLATQ